MITAVEKRPLMATIRDYVALMKPRITLMVIITAAGGMWLAPNALPVSVVAIMLLTTAAVVGAANTLNMYLERDTDGLMQRTMSRPLPDQRLEPRSALIFGISLGLVSVPILWLGVNPLTGLLGAIALVSYVAVYTPLKQITPAALLVGAIPGALPPLMGWTAATGELGGPGLVLFGILFLWQIPHFIAISLFRKGDYEAAGLKVLPSVRGDRVARYHCVVYTLALLPVSLMLYPLGVAGPVYTVVAMGLGLLFAGVALQGLRASADERWAKRLFFTSLIYLTVLFGTLMADAV